MTFICSVCIKVFAYYDLTKEFACSLCKQEFPFEKFICSDCNKDFICFTCSKAFVCNICNAGFVQSSNLKRHTKTVHDKTSELFRCSYCEKIFNVKYNLSRHITRTHNISIEVPETEALAVCTTAETPSGTTTETVAEASTEEACISIDTPSGNVTETGNEQKKHSVIESVNIDPRYIRCNECNVPFKSVTFFRTHLVDYHKKNLKEEVLRFPDMNDFNKWKHETEQKELTFFVLKKRNKTPFGLKYYYHCFRSGFKYSKNLSKVQRRRRALRDVFHKARIECTAGITCLKKPDEIFVNYFPDHYGHRNEIPIEQLSAVEERNFVLKGVKKGIGPIKCLECDITFKCLLTFRTHLRKEHKKNMIEEELHFPNMNAFQKWKHEIEQKELTSFTKQTGARKLSLGSMNYYHCHRSGPAKSKTLKGVRQRILKSIGSQKIGIQCTAGIQYLQTPNEIVVKYFPNHYGHGNEVSIVHPSAEEHAAIEENEANGIPFEKLLDDFQDTMQSTDAFQVHTLQQKDYRFIKNAVSIDEYTPCISELESVDQWVSMCCKMEDSPILYYRREKNANSKEEFMLIIMTEFQKQILMSSSRQVVCVDSVGVRKGGQIKLTILLIMDEYDVAFPVAFCFSNKINKHVTIQFLTSIKESTGPLLSKFFMSSSQKFYYESWVEVMNDHSSQCLWSTWFTLERFRRKLNTFNLGVEARDELFKMIKKIVECQNENFFGTMFKNCLDNLLSNSNYEKVGNYVKERFGSNPEVWASCYRKDIKFSTNFHLDMMHRTFHYCCGLVRTKRLDKFIFAVMKYVKYKMLARLANVLDEEKIALSMEAINAFHQIGLEIASEYISSLSDKIWLIRSEDTESVYVTRECETCPEHCNLRCSECDVCVHMYSCSCVQSLINANLCEHIHAVVWKFVMPDFSPPPSPMQDNCDEMENDDTDTFPDSCSELLESALKRTHDIFKNLRKNRCKLNKFSLTEIVKKLNDINNMCSDKDMNDCEPTSVLNDDSGCAINPVETEEFSQPLLLQKFPTLLPSSIPPFSQYVYLVPNYTTDIQGE